jgi:carbonic anhydrase
MTINVSPLKVLAALAAGLFSFSAHAHDHAKHWGYAGEVAPSHWAELDPAFETCGIGQAQSPINISKTEKVELPALDFQYSQPAPTIVKKNEAFESVFTHLPRTGETISVEDLKLDLAAMLPSNKGYYSFAGSLTTPPCSEGVSWMVLKTPVTLSTKQIGAFRQLFKFNARPIQAVHDRVVKESL